MLWAWLLIPNLGTLSWWLCSSWLLLFMGAISLAKMTPTMFLSFTLLLHLFLLPPLVINFFT